MNSMAANHDHNPLHSDKGAERRGAYRSLPLNNVVKIRRGSDEGLARCRNISETGINIETSVPISLMETVHVEITDGDFASARVVWTNGSQCGLSFDRDIDCADFLSCSAGRYPNRRPPRLGSSIAAQVCLDGGERRATTISNISQRGMLISHEGDFTPGLAVKVILKDGTEKSAIVQWAESHFAGLYIMDEIGVADLGSASAFGQGTAMVWR